MMVVVKMAASWGSFFSSSRLVRRAGSVWRSMGPFGIFCGDPRGAKSLRWAGELAGCGAGEGAAGVGFFKFLRALAGAAGVAGAVGGALPVGLGFWLGGGFGGAAVAAV